MSEPSSNLYKILNVLYSTDQELWRKLSGALGNITTLQSDVSSFALSSISADGTDYASRYALVKNGVQVGDTLINIPKDQFLSDAAFGYMNKADGTGTWVDASGKTTTYKYPTLKLVFELEGSKNPVYIPVNNLVDTYTAGSGLTLNNNEFSLTVEDADGFLTRTENGIKLSGIQDSINSTVDTKISNINTSLAEAITITTNALTGIADTSTISGSVNNRNASFGVKVSSENGNAISASENGLYVKGIEAGDNISITEDSSTGKLKIDNTFAPILANGTTSGMVYGSDDVTITNGQITVKNAEAADKVNNSIKVFDFSFDGSNSGKIIAGTGLSSTLNGNENTISVDTTVIATKNYVEQVSLLVASAVGSSDGLEFWTDLDDLVDKVSGLYDEIKG